MPIVTNDPTGNTPRNAKSMPRPAAITTTKTNTGNELMDLILVTSNGAPGYVEFERRRYSGRKTSNAPAKGYRHLVAMCI